MLTRKSRDTSWLVPTVSSASHNVFVYRFKSNDRTNHEGAEDDGEHGAGRALLRSLTNTTDQNESDIHNTLTNNSSTEHTRWNCHL